MADPDPNLIAAVRGLAHAVLALCDHHEPETQQQGRPLGSGPAVWRGEERK